MPEDECRVCRRFNVRPFTPDVLVLNRVNLLTASQTAALPTADVHGFEELGPAVHALELYECVTPLGIRILRQGVLDDESFGLDLYLFDLLLELPDLVSRLFFHSVELLEALIKLLLVVE